MCLLNTSKLLRHEDENPFATAMAATQDSVLHTLDSVEKDLVEEDKLIGKPAGTELDILASCPSAGDTDVDMKILRRVTGLIFWRNWDKFFDR
jgi:hypothetical protein